MHGDYRDRHPRQAASLYPSISCRKEYTSRHPKCLPAVGGALELALREVHTKSKLPTMLCRDRMALGHIDPQPRKDEVPLHPSGHPDALPETGLHEHEVVEVHEQLDAIPLSEHHEFSHNLENTQGAVESPNVRQLYV